MRCLKVVDINDAFVDELWNKVSSSGSFYSIGDGVVKRVFRKVLFDSNFVLQVDTLTVRLEVKEAFIELHPIAFGPSTFRYAKEALRDIIELRDKLFPSKPICCIIPDSMQGAKRLARIAGMTQEGKTTRLLSGVQITCEVFVWR